MENEKIIENLVEVFIEKGGKAENLIPLHDLPEFSQIEGLKKLIDEL